MKIIAQIKTNWNFLVIVIILAAIVGGGILIWQEIQNYSPNISGTGTIKFIDVEGGFYGIESDNGEKYDTVNLNSDNIEFKDFLQDGLRVRFIVRELKDAVSIHMWGKVVLVNEIEKIQSENVNCEEIQILEERADCYTELAIAKNKPSMCWKVEMASLSSSCWEYFGMRWWPIYRNEVYGFEMKYPSALENGELGCRISETEDNIFIGPISLIFFDSQGLTLDEWIDKKIAESEEDTKEMQESLKQAGHENWQEFGSKLLSRKEILMAGEKAVKLSYQFIGAGFDLPVEISIKMGNQIYDFRTNDANLVDEECAAKFGKKPSEAMELMLSTFRFIDNEKYCEKDEDCACGVNKTTRECFYGNKDYVDTTQQCPDFCTGIAANLEIKCINNECKQISITQDQTSVCKQEQQKYINEHKIDLGSGGSLMVEYTGTKEQITNLMKSYNLEIITYWDSLSGLLIKVTPGTEIEWLCKLKQNSLIKNVSYNELLEISN